LKKLFLVSVFLCVLCGSGFSQNLTTVSASNITDINGSKLAAGQLCFLITDQSDNPISVSIGGGGQALKRGYCSAVTAGVVTGFTVPNPANTSPTGIYYRVTVKDSSTGQEVLRYTLVSFTGATFNFDNYAPTNLAQGAPLSGTTVSGNLSGNGNATFTGTVTGSNIPGNILQQIFSSGVGQTQRTAFNMMAGLTCSDNAGTSRTDCRLGTLTTVTFSATPTFDASTASTFKLTLTGNVTSSTLSNAVAGEPLAFEICQDGVGGRTFVPPANVQGWLTISSTAGACSLEVFYFDGSNAQPDLLAGLTGDATSSPGSTVTTVAKVNGVSFPSGPSTHSVPVVTAANTVTWKVLPDCQDTTGNHLNYTQSTDTWSCGTSVPASVVTLTGIQTLTNKTLTSPTSTGTDSGTETLTNKTLTAPIIGTTTISEAPRMVLISGFQTGNLAAANLGSAATSKGVTVEAIAVHSSTSAVCTVNPSIRVRNAGATVTTPTLTLTTGTSDWITTGNAVNYGGADLLFIEVTSPGTCTTPPSNIIVNVTGRMQ
jgi:hypothetical protein